MMKTRLALIATAVLAACGGGGSDSGSSKASATPVANQQQSAEGIYNAATNGTTQTNVILDDNSSFYMVFTTSSGISDIVVGTGTVSGSKFTSTSATDFFFGTGSSAIAVNGSFSSKQNINGTLQVTGQTTEQFSTNYNKAYDNTIAASQIAGSYSGANATVAGGAANTLSVNNDLSFTGVTGACTYAGNLQERHGSVLNATVKFTAGCPFANQTINGIALFDPTAGQLLIIVNPKSRSDIFVALDTISTPPSTSSGSSVCSVTNPNIASCMVGGTSNTSAATPITTPAAPATPASGSSTSTGSTTCTDPNSCNSSSSGSTSSGVKM